MTKRPNIQIDDVVREITDDEYTALIESGWTPGEDTPNDAGDE